MLLTFVGGVALLTSFIGLLPQIIKTYQTQKADDLSLAMLINYALGSLAWVIYGCLTDAPFVWVSNLFCLSSSLWLIQFKYRQTKTAGTPVYE